MQQQLDECGCPRVDDIICSNIRLFGCAFITRDGCAAVVVDVGRIWRPDAAKIPANRLMAHFQYPV
jgi:hypothetical protein